MSSKCGLILFALILIPHIESANRLNEYISHYETLDYDTKHVHASHNRAKRSVSENQHVHLQFSAHGEKFRIRLKRDLTTFSDNLQIVHTVNNKPSTKPLETSHIYEGEVLGDSDSYVFGSIINGVFEGKIHTSKDVYYVEKAHHYFPNQSNSNFHSVIYRDQHVDDPYQEKRTVHPNGCGLTDEVSQWMERVQNSNENYEQDETENNINLNTVNDNNNKHKSDFKTENNKIHQYHDHHQFNKYSEEANIGASHRSKRAVSRIQERNTCSLYIQTDPLIWRHIRESIPDHNDPSKANLVNDKVKEEILSLVAHHVAAVNFIYRNTKFDGRMEHRNIRFEVQRIKIDDDTACSPHYIGEPNQFCMENIDVSNFLNLHSLGNHEDFCLAYVFTYRDFTGGTLGLAWVASASGASGGICEKYKTYTETIAGMYQSTKRSLNTGIITFVNYNSRVPPKVSQLTLAHEIGHNFGSPHDYPLECRPGGLPGNFIMFASATSGDRPNNSKFSQCSIRNISNVLDAIQESKKRNCFKVSEGAFCGNKIVEIGEECDCGFNADECRDDCCYPRIISEYEKNLNETAKGCSRKARTECSPSQGPCCDPNSCTFIPFKARNKCREESECSLSSTCNGTSPECPDPKPREDKTKCNNGTQLCINGDCAGSICLIWNKTECFLTSSNTKHADKRKLCELACQDGNDTNTCKSTSEFGHLFNLPKGGISLRPGAPCDNFQGYCDVFLKCRAVDAEGPLVRLKNLLLNEETLKSVKQWVIDNWYVCVFMGIGFMIFMGIFIKCCAVHTPSSNPKKRPARRISDTLRRPMNTLRRMRHPHANPNMARSIPPPSDRPRNTELLATNTPASSGNNSGHGYSNRSGENRRGPSSSSSSSTKQSNSSRPTAHGYGGGRGQYYSPKGVFCMPVRS